MKLHVLILLLIMPTSFFAQNEAFSQEIFIGSTKDSLKYRRLIPENLEKNRKYPLVLFLHGADERGKDNESQLLHGGTMFSNPLNRDKYPSFVLFPQCPNNFYWSIEKRPEQGFDSSALFSENPPITSQMKLVIELLNDFTEKNPVDEKRIYVVGLSMGAMATFDLVCRLPDKFAAAIPICGAVNPERLKHLKTNTQFRIYHGDSDQVVPVNFSRNAYKALKKTGKNAEYIEFYGVGHNSWHPAFNMPDFLSWLYRNEK